MQYSLYSAQIAEAVKEMEDTEARLIQYVDTAESNMNSRVNSAESLTNSNKAELNSRMDTLDKRLDANVSASTDKDKDYAAEVVDARVDEEGTKYGSVGSHLDIPFLVENGKALDENPSPTKPLCGEELSAAESSSASPIKRDSGAL